MVDEFAHCDHCDQHSDEIEPGGHTEPCTHGCNGEICIHGWLLEDCDCED